MKVRAFALVIALALTGTILGTQAAAPAAPTAAADAVLFDTPAPRALLTTEPALPPPTVAPAAPQKVAAPAPKPVQKKAAPKPAAKPQKAAKKPSVRTTQTSRAVTRTARVVAGILPSAYRGPYYDARWESFRRCVVKRESNGHYDARNPTSSASGAYQFLRAWTATIQKWTGEHVPIYQMSRYAQDLAFWRALNHGKGARNWAGGGYSC